MEDENNKKYNKLEKKSKKIYKTLEQKVDAKTLKLINEYKNLEIELESFCNQ